MTTSLDLLDAVYEALLAAGTDAGGRVYRPGDWPTQHDHYPITKLRLVGEQRQSLGRGGPSQFTTTATIRIVSEVSEAARVEDLGATAAETALWALKRQNEVAIVNSYPLSRLIQQVAAMRSQLAFNSEAATHLAGIQSDVDLEFYEGPEDFAQPDLDDLEEVDLAAAAYAPAGFSISTI